MFRRLYLRIALLIFIASSLVLLGASAFTHFRNTNYIEKDINKKINSVMAIDINASPSSFNKFSDSTVFLYFEGSTTPFTEQRLYSEENYQEIYDAIISSPNYSGKLRIHNFYLAYKGEEVLYDDGHEIKDCYEYVVYDYTDMRESADTTFKMSIFTGLIGTLILGVISFILAYFFMKPVREAHEREKRLLADASHELKTPVAIIMSDLDVINNNNSKTVSSQQKWIDSIKKQNERMDYLIKEILKYSKLDSLKGEKEVFNLSSVVDEEVLIDEALAFENKVTIESNIQPDINYFGIKSLLRKLVDVLLDNAIKYNRKGGHIYISLTQKGKRVILEMKNNGNAIASENLDKIFERFYKVDKSRKQGDNKSFGLGLSIAKSIVDLHKGKIEVESKEDLTTFRVTL